MGTPFHKRKKLLGSLTALKYDSDGKLKFSDDYYSEVPLGRIAGGDIVYNFSCPDVEDAESLGFQIDVSNDSDFTTILTSTATTTAAGSASSIDLTKWSYFNGNSFVVFTDSEMSSAYYNNTVSVDIGDMANYDKIYSRVRTWDGISWSDYFGDIIVPGA